MKVWIDLSNSPHPLLFAPVARRLEELDHEVLVTARDNAQTVELALQHWPDVEVFGGPSPKNRLRKVATLIERIGALRGYAKAHRPDIALSHNSYAQIVAARSIGAGVVTAMDYEHQPANHLAFRLAHTILLPKALGRPAVRRQGAAGKKVRSYPGLKEELYLGDFEPNPEALTELGVERTSETAIVVARTPPSRAAYHRLGNPVFFDVLKKIGRLPNVHCIVLTRYPEQREMIRAVTAGDLTLPESAVDSRSLLFNTDLMIGAGGTMTREAALLGVPTWTVFAARAPLVDQWLETHGRLQRLISAEDIGTITQRHDGPPSMSELRERAQPILDAFVDATLAQALSKGAFR